MRFVRSPRFKRQYKKAPDHVKMKLAKQLNYLLTDITHPSLDSKLYDPKHRTWQARIDRNWRFYFEIHSEEYHLLVTPTQRLDV